MRNHKKNKLKDIQFHTDVYYNDPNDTRSVNYTDDSGKKDTSTKTVNDIDESGKRGTSTRTVNDNDYSGLKDTSIKTEVIRDNSHTTQYRGMKYENGGWFPDPN